MWSQPNSLTQNFTVLINISNKAKVFSMTAVSFTVVHSYDVSYQHNLSSIIIVNVNASGSFLTI